MTDPGSRCRIAVVVMALGVVSAYGASCTRQTANLMLVNGRVYTLSWPDPDREGRPAPGAPHDDTGWRPDADTVAIDGDRIVFVGRRSDAPALAGDGARTVDLDGATVVPGLIDAHVHLANLGASLDRVNLVGVPTEADVVARVVERAATVPRGEWIVGWGWDEGAWSNRLPDMRLLSERVPNHPVVLHGLHTFAVWGNRLAFERAGITRSTAAPVGGEIRKDARGNPTGILLNNAGALLTGAVPAPSRSQLASRIVGALETLAAHGYTSVHEAGVDAPLLSVLEELERDGRLPLPVYAMLAARDTALVDTWRTRAPAATGRSVTVRAVKAFYDGAMGSRGAFFLEPYADRPGHRGVGGAEYGFDRERMAAMMAAGFQVTIHAIGDRANREALDFFESVLAKSPQARATRPRIEHAQVVSPADLPRFAALGVIASMQPSHAVEDLPWAEARIGPERIKGAYAWRLLRRAGARLVLNSDLPGTDYDIFYGLHSAVTRTSREGQPTGGWRREEALSIEEALRGWTSWAAYAGFREQEIGTIAAGRLANLTVMTLDPFQVAGKDPARLMDGGISMTIVAGKIVHER